MNGGINAYADADADTSRGKDVKGKVEENPRASLSNFMHEIKNYNSKHLHKSNS